MRSPPLRTSCPRLRSRHWRTEREFKKRIARGGKGRGPWARAVCNGCHHRRQSRASSYAIQSENLTSISKKARINCQCRDSTSVLSLRHAGPHSDRRVRGAGRGCLPFGLQEVGREGVACWLRLMEAVYPLLTGDTPVARGEATSACTAEDFSLCSFSA
jgi:hypothetical protein